jgi:hypothetical protein
MIGLSFPLLLESEIQFIFRGQKYFWDNLYGQTQALLYGLLAILSEPRDLKFLDSTGKSSDKVAARQRYMSTVGHIVIWYRFDLKPGTL